MIAVRKSIQSSNIIIEDSASCCSNKREFLFVKLRLNFKNVIIGVAYISPSADIILEHTNFCVTLESIYKKNKDAHFIILGDFNLSYILWDQIDDSLTFTALSKATSEISLAADILGNQLSEMGMQQFHPNHPDKQYTLDLAFSSIPSFRYLYSDDFIVPVDREHHISSTFQKSQWIDLHHISRYNFNKLDNDLIDMCIQETNWVELFNFELFGIDGCIEIFYEVLHVLIDIAVPKLRKIYAKFPEWYSVETINCIILKKQLHTMWKITENIDYFIE